MGDLDLPQRRKRYTISQEEEQDAQQMCPCGTAKEGRFDIVGESEMYQERDVLDMRKIDQCDVEKFSALPVHSSEKTIAILGDRRRP